MEVPYRGTRRERLEALQRCCVMAFVCSRKPRPGEIVSKMPGGIREKLQCLRSDDIGDLSDYHIRAWV